MLYGKLILTMPRIPRWPLPDSVAAHPEAARALGNIFATSLVQPGDTVTKWRTDPRYAQLFSGIDYEKFRKRFTRLMQDHEISSTLNDTARTGEFIPNLSSLISIP